MARHCVSAGGQVGWGGGGSGKCFICPKRKQKREKLGETGKAMLPGEGRHKTLGRADQNRGQDHPKQKWPVCGWACPGAYF